MKQPEKILTPEDVHEYMTSGGVERYDSIRKKAEDDGRETSTPPGRHLLRDAVGKLTQAIIDWLPDRTTGPGRRHLAVKILKRIEPKVAALLAAETIIDCISTDRPAASAGITIGKVIEDECRFRELKARMPEQWKDAVKESKKKSGARQHRVLRAIAAQLDNEWERWTTKERLIVGTVLIELMRTSTGMITIRHFTVPGRAHRQAKILATPELRDWLVKAHEEHRVSFPLYLPTVEPPEPWVSPDVGGYPSNLYMRWPMIQAPRKVREKNRHEDCPDFYRAINSVQDTAWCVNTVVLDVFDHLWTEGLGIAGLPPRDEEDLPPRPHNINEDEAALKQWKREAARVYDRNARRMGKRLRAARVHRTAMLYRNQPFWYPHKADFRGRIYPIPQFLNPQGDDLSKGLLRFNEAEPVNTPEARRWLAIHGANCWGLDKAPMAERLGWVEANAGMIQAVAEDPLTNDTWNGADEPWQFLAWCLDWAALLEAEDAGTIHYSQLPVAMDGTNNGLQLYSLLTRDPEGAAATNVTPSDTPRDIYQDVADLATKKMEADADGLDEKKREYATNLLRFVDGRLPRAATKRPVMVRPYGGTRQSCVRYIEDWIEGEIVTRGQQVKRPYNKAFAHVLYLAGVVEDAIKETVVKAEEAMLWIREAAGILSDSGLPIQWRTPCGLLVSQYREKEESASVFTSVAKNTIVRWYRRGTGKVSKTGMKNALPPNLIHSLDAAVLIRTINSCHAEGVTSLAMVHDSYATHAAHAPTLARILRDEVVAMFTPDLLGEFKAELEERYRVNLPPLPTYGTLNINEVKDSTYFFA